VWGNPCRYQPEPLYLLWLHVPYHVTLRYSWAVTDLGSKCPTRRLDSAGVALCEGTCGL
jgi:hypothetical protein